MILPDVNVLLYAFRSDSVDHERYRNWLSSVVNGPEAFGISRQVLASVIRICTHPRIFVRPSKLEEVLEFSKILLQQSNVTLIEPGDRHWSIFEKLCRECGARGNLVQDAWFAALAIESGCQWITTDRDYARFSQLNWSPPI